MSEDTKKTERPQTLKLFFIKLISILVAIIILINLTFNLIFAERLEKVDKILLLNKSQFRNEMKSKIRKELEDGLKKENMIAEEDKILIYKMYKKIIKEFEGIDKSKI